MFPIAMSIVMTTLGLVCLGISILGMPGNWLLLLMSVIAALSFHSESISHIPWWGVGVMLAFALLGEGLELLAGALGVGKLGGSKRSAALAVVGSVVGAIVGLFVGLPIPVVGSLIASVVFGGIGACVGPSLESDGKGKTGTEACR